MLIFTLLLRWLTALFGAGSAPVRVLQSLRGGERERFAGAAERWTKRGHALAYEDEDEAAVAWRLERLAWIVRDPRRALKHMARSYRGLIRLRLGGQSAPPSFTPPTLPSPDLLAGAPALSRIPDS